MRSRRSATPVEPSVEVEVLERGELAIDERLVPEEADPPPLDRDLERPARRRREPDDQPEERRLPRTVRPGHDEGAARLELEGDVPERGAQP